MGFDFDPDQAGGMNGMNKPGFRQGHRHGNGGAPRSTFGAVRSAHGPSAPVRHTPFSQVQILQLMKNEFARARRYGYPVASVLLEVDRLDALADLHGSDLREHVGQALQALVTGKVRDGDHVGVMPERRLLLVLPHTTAEGARQVAERMRVAFGELQVDVAGNRLALTLSAGLAACDDKETLFFDTLLAQAEASLEEAVADGGDRVVVFRRIPGA